MAFRVPPFVWETVSSPGSGAITTAGTLPSGEVGARAFASGGVGASDGIGNLSVGDTFPYSLRGQTTGSTEMGVGTVTAISGNTLSFSRGVIYPSTGAVSFSETCDLLVAELPGATRVFADMQPSVNYYVWPTVNPDGASGGATKGTNSTVRSTVRWLFAQKPLSFGVVVNAASAGGNCQIRLYEPTANYQAGALLYDSGTLSTGTAGVVMGTTVSGGIELPDVFIYDFAVDTNGNGAGYVHGTLHEIGGPLDMSGGSSGSYPGTNRAVYYTGIQSPASNPCSYDGTVNSYYSNLPPSLMAQF